MNPPKGVHQNVEPYAYTWFNLAVYHGRDEGAKVRELIAQRMTPDQIAEAQEPSKELLNKIEANKKAKE